MNRIEDCETPFGPVTIFGAKATGAFTYEQGGCCQSEADRLGWSLQKVRCERSRTGPTLRSNRSTTFPTSKTI